MCTAASLVKVLCLTNAFTIYVGVLQKLGRGIWTGLSAVMLVVTALGLLSLMAGVLADLVLAPFR